LILLLSSSFVESGAGTGWTVYIKQWNFYNFKKFYLMRKTPQFILNVANHYSIKLFLFVKMWFAILFFYINSWFSFNLENRWGQSAWLRKYLIISSDQRLNIEQPENNILLHNHSKSINRSNISSTKSNFHQWLVGFVDGDGSFTITYQKSNTGKLKWNLFFKISQSNYNLRVLYYIKKELGYGTVQLETKTNMADFRIRNKDIFNKVIFPIFDKYPLLTSKYFEYSKFKKAYEILENNCLSIDVKNKLLLELKKEIRSNTNTYISPAWEKVNYSIKSTYDAKSIMSKYWLIGFTEAEGSFYIVKKSTTRLVHAFEIAQKLDVIVLESIAHILGISVKNKKTYNTVVTTNSRAINNIIEYYKNSMKGMKALEYRIWAKSFINDKGNFEKLNKIRNLVRDIRLIRLNKNCKIKSNNNISI
jgi:LAGLIDADG endonuclease